MNRAYLSRNDIEQIAKRVSEQYKSVAVPQKHLCYVVDPVELADVLGLQVDFQYLTKDGSILGLTTPQEALIPVLDMDSNPFLYHLDGRTVLVEQRLDNLPRFRGRRNFTIAHEIARFSTDYSRMPTGCSAEPYVITAVPASRANRSRIGRNGRQTPWALQSSCRKMPCRRECSSSAWVNA